MEKKELHGPSRKKNKMKNSNVLIALSLCLVFLLASCNNDKKDNRSTNNNTPPKTKVKVPSFNKDSAFYFVEKQLAFGPRVPGTKTHQACKNWFIEKFESYGADVIDQAFTANIYTGDKWSSNNIIAQFNPKHKNRVILSAHWDSRFIAEEDSDKNKKNDPIPGADDGGSGVGVLIEIARLISENPIDLGVDIILWDAEDQGERGGVQGSERTWCLGSQYWATNQHTKNYRPLYGINLDMVGAKNPRFAKDDVSMKYASKTMNKVWKLAMAMGFTDMFTNESSGGLTDDHLFINIMAGIPMIDIINQPKGSRTGFGPHWHTHNDDISAIDKRTLKVVGQVVTATIYKESDGSIKSFE